jgi:hypothetical protein
MSDPTEANKANPHPVSGHRTPREIAQDEAGPIGKPDLNGIAKKVKSEKSSRDPAERHTPRALTSKRPTKRR